MIGPWVHALVEHVESMHVYDFDMEHCTKHEVEVSGKKNEHILASQFSINHLPIRSSTSWVELQEEGRKYIERWAPTVRGYNTH